MKIIKLSKKYETIVDDEDYEYLNQWKWYTFKSRPNLIYVTRRINNKTIYLHRFILNITNKNTIIDHIDGNPLNNQKSNLRICTQSENMQNARKHKNCSSKYKGVCWDKNRNKWIVNLDINKKRIHIGRFNLEKDAALAYNKAATKYFGSFAKLNEI